MDPTELTRKQMRIYNLLLNGERMTAKDIAIRLGMLTSTASTVARGLRKNGIIEGDRPTKSGRCVYWINVEPVKPKKAYVKRNAYNSTSTEMLRILIDTTESEDVRSKAQEELDRRD